MIVLLIFLSQFDAQDKGKAPVVSIEPIAIPFDDDIVETPKKIKNKKFRNNENF